jgi:SAM-dependent methyltransferase
MAQTWDPDRYARTARYVPELATPVVELLAPRRGERILDLGCGDGALTEKLAAAGCRVVGVDASLEQVAAARPRCASRGRRAPQLRRGVPPLAFASVPGFPHLSDPACPLGAIHSLFLGLPLRLRPTASPLGLRPRLLGTDPAAPQSQAHARTPRLYIGLIHDMSGTRRPGLSS